jgi:hypothetical protein
MNKLDVLVELEGYSDLLELLEANITDSVCPAICMNGDCNYTTGMEPDQEQGYCELCQTNTVKSAMVLAGVI